MVSANAPRLTPSLHVQSQVKLFYEGHVTAPWRCVVSGEDTEVELHHLDETRSNSKTPQNFVPLLSSLNKNIDKRKTRALHESITAQGLQNLSAFHYSRGRYAYGYGCSILGATLAFNIPWAPKRPKAFYLLPENAILSSANALLNLRPLNRVDYAIYVLRTIVCPVVQMRGEEIERPTRARLLMEIGSYFRDAGDHQTSMEFISLAHRILRNEPRSPRVKSLFARLWHHEAICNIMIGKPSLASDCFRRAEEEMTIDYSVGYANQALYEAQILLKQERPQYDSIRHLLKRIPIGSDPMWTTRWTQFEGRLTEAEADHLKGDEASKKRAFDAVQDALDEFTKEGIFPTQATFPSVMYGFMRKYPTERRRVFGLIRTLSVEFCSLARQVERHQREWLKRE